MTNSSTDARITNPDLDTLKAVSTHLRAENTPNGLLLSRALDDLIGRLSTAVAAAPDNRSDAAVDTPFLLRHLLAMRSMIANDEYASGFGTQKAYRDTLLLVFDGSSLDLNANREGG